MENAEQLIYALNICHIVTGYDIANMETFMKKINKLSRYGCVYDKITSLEHLTENSLQQIIRSKRRSIQAPIDRENIIDR